MYNLNRTNKKTRRNDMCSNASITEILGINDNNLVILDNEKEKIKGIEYTVLRGKLSYRPTCCPKCGIVNENYDIIKNGSQIVKILFDVTPKS